MDTGGFIPRAPSAGLRQLKFHWAGHLFIQNGLLSPVPPMHINIPDIENIPNPIQAGGLWSCFIGHVRSSPDSDPPLRKTLRRYISAYHQINCLYQNCITYVVHFITFTLIFAFL